MNKVQHDSEVPAHGQQFISAVAFIHQKFDGVDKVFLPKRAKTKKFLPDVYELPGGHIDFGENIVEGLKREIMEEFGMKSEIGDTFYSFTYTNEVKGSHSIEVVYFGRFAEEIQNIKTIPEDHSTYGWFSKDELSGIYSDQKGADDIEFKVIRKGFDLLEGKPLIF